jgi:hypothetical protein
MFGMSRKAIFLAVTLSGLVAKKSVTAEPNVKTTDAILETPPMVAGIRKNQTNPLMHAIYDARANGKDHGSDVRRLANEENEPVTDLDNALHLQWKDDDRLLVEVASTTEAADISLRHHLEEYGFETTACAKYVCSGYLDIALLPEVEQLPSVLSIKPSMSIAWGLLRGEEFGRRKVEEVDASPFGSIKSRAFEALQVDKLRAAYPHLTGTGMKIGVLSDSYNTKGGADDDIASGDLPPNVVVVKEAPRRRKDEGRAILQLIHDLAPDAELYFRATEGFVDFAAGINELADLGCDVIIDDICMYDTHTIVFVPFLLFLTYLAFLHPYSKYAVNPGQPFFQEGLVAQTASDVAEIRGIPYFSAAGNSGRTSYESQYQATACGINNQMEDYKSCHDFGGGNTLQEIQVSEIACFVLQWDDPFATVSGPSSGGAKTDIDVLLVDPETREFADWMSADINQGMDPLEYWCFPPGTYHIAFALFDGPAPNLIKWATPDDDNVVSVNPPPNSGYITSQANTPHTAGVGAAFELQIFSELQLEPFSSAGGTPLLFDRDGSRKAKPLTPQQPLFVGPDGYVWSLFVPTFFEA